VHESRRWSRHIEWLPLTALLVAGLLSWGFIAVADGVRFGGWPELDEAVLMAMRDPSNLADPVGPVWLEEMARDFTALGGVGVLTLITATATVLLALTGSMRAALYVAVSTGLAIVLSLWMKEVFDRPRPELVPHHARVHTASFPSGHSMMSAAVYLTLGAMAARFSAQRMLQIFFSCLAVAITVIVGVTRVYLGVHWPSDVLGGWCAGATWANVCWVIAGRLQAHGQLETGMTAVVTVDEEITEHGANPSG
jgi:undecaprenyl-diphosphatase